MLLLRLLMAAMTSELLHRLKVLHIRTIEPIESRSAVIMLDMRVAVFILIVFFPTRVELERPKRCITDVLSISVLSFLGKSLLMLPDPLLELILLLGVFLGLGTLGFLILHSLLQIREKVIDLGLPSVVLLLYQAFISAVLHVLAQGLEDLDFAVLVAFGDGTLLNLHQEPLLHLYLLELPIPPHLFICEAPAAENLSLGPEHSLLAGLVED